MGLLEKFILAAAKKIEAKKEKEQQQLREKEQATNELYKSYEKEAEKYIQTFISDIEKGMRKKGCHLKPGDTAILNYYELDYPCRNGWDTGPTEILRNVPVEVKRKPLKVKIKDVNISYSYYEERLNSFFNRYYGDHLKRALDEGAVVQWFMQFMGNGIWSENYGLYWDAKFEPLNFDFKPSLGLNAGSFLVEESNGAIFTKKYWKREGKILTKWEKANHKKKTFDTVLDGMLKKYRNNQI